MSPHDRPDTFPGKLLAGLRQCGFESGRILVAVSGGADSVAMLRGLAALRNTNAQQPDSTEQHFDIVVAHVDHQIREDSGADAAWVQSLAEKLELDCEAEAVNVPARVEDNQESIEEAARQARYEVLLRIAQEARCDAIAVAHTMDDQAETVLHHLIRGTSVTGLRGMLWSRPLTDAPSKTVIPLIRPMLKIYRTEIEAWLQEIGQGFRTDPTNADDELTRNRIRHQLVPLLTQEFNPQVRKVLSTLAEQASEISDLLQSLTERLADDSLVQSSENVLRIDCTALTDQPPVLARETLLTIWKQAGWPLQRMGHREWQKLFDLLTQPNGATSLPAGISARRRNRLLILSRENGSTGRKKQ